MYGVANIHGNGSGECSQEKRYVVLEMGHFKEARAGRGE